MTPDDLIQCQATDSGGRQCPNLAEIGSLRCWRHHAARLECLGGPLDGLTFTHHQLAVAFIYDASQRDPDALAVGWRVWNAQVDDSCQVRGFYVCDHLGPCWLWIPAEAPVQTERAGG